MTLFKLDQYDVLIQDGDQTTAHHVIIFNADKLAAEAEAPKYGLNVKIDSEGTPDISGVMGAHIQALEVWAALKRAGKYSKPFAIFKNTDCLAIQDGGSFEMDPTQPEGVTPSPSPSAKSGPRSRNGSTRKSTSG